MYECNEYVSVVILSYNSFKTIEETLYSVYGQTYEYLDLIISDDASSDDTICLIKSWIDQHSSRFRRIKLNINKMNIGICENFDRAIKMVDTKWVKFIAADDVLTEDCVINDINYVKNNNINTLLYTNMLSFKVINGIRVTYNADLYELWYLRKISSLSPEIQFRCLLREDIKFSPTGFMNASLYKDLGGIVKCVRNIEDWPLRLLFTEKGYKIYYFDMITVLYRIGDSVSHTKGCFFNMNHICQKRKLKKLLIYPNVSKYNILYYYNELVEYLRIYIICNLFDNRIGIVSKYINYILMILNTNKVKKLIITNIIKFYPRFI